MKHTLTTTLCAALISLYSLFTMSCSDDKGPKNTTTDSTAKAKYPKMSAKERLAKNNILEKHMNWATNNLKGKVKSVIKTTFKISKTGEKIFDSKEENLFDTKGNLIEYGTLSESGKTNYKSTFMYDANNNDTAGVGYNAEGKITAKGITKYDNRGNEIGQISYSADGKTESKRGYKYDDMDNLTELDFYAQNGTLNRKWTFTYDENGFRIGNLNYDSLGNPERDNLKRSRKFDANGNYLYGVRYNRDGTIAMRDTSKYDNNGHDTADVYCDTTGKVISKYVMTYDEHGTITSFVIYQQNGSIDENYSSYDVYEYDTTGNITKKSEFKLVDGKKELTEINEMVIVYY